MKTPVVAIGLDAADPVVLEEWMSQGHLKNLSRVREQGAYGRLENIVNYCGVPTPAASTERLWAMTWTGCMPDKTGFWGTSKFYPESYGIDRDILKVGCDFEQNPPFYALGEDYRVFVLDPPTSGLSSQVNGLQVLAWGGHYPFTPSVSVPAEVLPEMIREYGENPVLYKDDGIWWDKAYEKWVPGAIQESVEKRAQVCRDYLKKEDWDFFFVGFGEAHTAGHDLWYTHYDHPVYEFHGKPAGPLMLEAFEHIDRAIGEILDAAPENAYITLFSPHGMGANYTDLLSMAVLPEMMYRFNFGEAAIAPGNPSEEPGPIISHPFRKSWMGEMWARNHEQNPLKRVLRPYLPSKLLRDRLNGLESPYVLMEQNAPLFWMPAMWYRPLWPQMRAFALPYFADGHVRINIQGREGSGIVPPSEYDAVCEEVIEKLWKLKDARTGKSIVRQISRTRRTPFDEGNLSDADIVVVWEEVITDVVDSPDFGRIGPIPHFRAGGHRSRGFFMAQGPGIAPNSSIERGQALDIAPTILGLLGAPIPDRLDGAPLLEVSSIRSAAIR
ncbi:alkaline phosphatase family protein [Thermoleptolyngbya sichuanensis XZ-Cy5]|uniref:alkaline phosphatase family protein n=1 Tax=Thermoleptolyngbya sichuanensis TaxID=2885951 RepID=UPI00240E2B7F|nr:alkaline phosphatase family protein [Thermoleptolyngbya sichuanensis XZ-Cy5]